MDDSRREFIKSLAKGVSYSSPAIISLMAPEALLAQGASMSMMTFCDFFPTICELFGWSSTNNMMPANMRGQRPASPTPPPPNAPAPGQRPPPGKRPA